MYWKVISICPASTAIPKFMVIPVWDHDQSGLLIEALTVLLRPKESNEQSELKKIPNRKRE